MPRRNTPVSLGHVLRSLLPALLLTLGPSALSAATEGVRDKPPEPGMRGAEVHPDLPDSFQQLLPRGGIPAIHAPDFVTADEADVPEDAWVLGIALDGEARAYSLNLLNQHEVVNDRLGELPIAAVW